MSKADRGFASMDKDRRAEISSAGGKAAHRAGKARTWTVEESRAAGRVGGRESQRRRKERLALANAAQTPNPEAEPAETHTEPAHGDGGPQPKELAHDRD
jgi:general stress protein YciG